jgi:hypothetical protein
MHRLSERKAVDDSACHDAPSRIDEISMQFRIFALGLLLMSLLAGCGGGGPQTSQAGARLLAASSAIAPMSFAGVSADYTVTQTANGYTVTSIASGIVTSVAPGARLRFADTSLGLDLDGGAGQGYRLYRAAFDRVPDAAGLGFWIGAMDQGVTLEAVAQAFIGSAEFTAMYGANPTNAAYVNGLYQHVLHRAGDPAGIAYWTGVLDRGAATRAQVLAGFGESAEDKAAVRDEIGAGIPFLEAAIPYLPAAHPGPTSFVDVQGKVTLDGSGSTVAVGKNIVYYWTLAQVPVGSKAVLADAGSARPSFTADVEGKYVLKLIVSDGINYSREVSKNVLALWRPAAGEVPASGNAFYVKVDPGQFSNLSGTFLYTNTVARFAPPVASSYLLSVTGDRAWTGWFTLPLANRPLTKGYFSEFTGVESPGGALSWSLLDNSNYCPAAGWFVVDEATYQDGELTALTIRFEQHCGINVAAMHGLYRWTKADASGPPGPGPVPASLWQPATGSVPTSGNYVYLEGEPGEVLSGGKHFLYTGPNAANAVRSAGNYADIGVSDGTSYFYGVAAPMYNLIQLAPGYYPGMLRYPFNNPAKGGMDWNLNSGGCGSLNGWFAVDKVTYDGDKITALDLRFEQHCDSFAPALHGKIHWVAPPD